MDLRTQAAAAAFVATLAAGIALGAEEAEAPPPKDLAELKVRVEALRAEHRIPGIGLAIVDRDGIVFAGGFGLADVASKTPATEHTMFRIGSTSKGLVALAALKLQAEGRLDLDATVASLAPEVEFQNPWEATDPVRVVHLLEHTAGFDDLHLPDYSHQDETRDNLVSALAFHPHNRVSRWRPGTRFAYCNAGPVIVAHIIAKIVGMPFEDYAEREFLEPIGMPRTSFFLDDEVKRTQATLYREDMTTPHSYWHIAMRPAGSINSSVAEMAEYARFYLNRGRTADGRQLVAPEALERMEHPATTLAARAGMRHGYGLHNYASYDDRGFLWHGHNGGVLGGASDFSYSHELGVGYSLLFNGVNEGAQKVSKLVRAYLNQGRPTPGEGVADESVSAEVGATYAGFYLGDDPRNALFAPLDALGGAMRLSYESGAFVLKPALGGEPARFVGVPGSATLLRHEDRDHPTMVLLPDDEGRGIGFATQRGSFRKVSALVAFVPLALVCAAAISVLATGVFALVWMARAWRKRIDLKPHLGLRLWPLAATAAWGAFFLSFFAFLITDDIFARYSTPTVFALGLAAFGVIAAVLSPIALIATLAPRHREAHRGLRGFSIATSAVYAALGVYWLAVGMIPMVTWR